MSLLGRLNGYGTLPSLFSLFRPPDISEAASPMLDRLGIAEHAHEARRGSSRAASSSASRSPGR